MGKMENNADYPLERSDMPIRILNALARTGIHTVGDLEKAVLSNRLDSIKQFGIKSNEYVVKFLKDFDLKDNSLAFLQESTDVALHSVTVRQLKLSKSAVVTLEKAGIINAHQLIEAQTNRVLCSLFQTKPDALAKVQEALIELEKGDRESFLGISSRLKNHFEYPVALSNLPVRIINALERSKITNLGDLIEAINNNEIMSIRNLGVKSMKAILDFLKEFDVFNNPCDLRQTSNSTDFSKVPVRQLGLTKKVLLSLERAGILTVFDLLSAYSQGRLQVLFRNAPKSLSEVREAVGLIHYTDTMSAGIAQPVKKTTWASIFESYFEILNDNEKIVFLSRFGYKKLPLEEIAKEIGVTRERVRQIQNKSITKLNRKLHHFEFQSTISQILEFISDKGEDISLISLEKGLTELGLLGEFQSPQFVRIEKQVSPLEALICWQNYLSNLKGGDKYKIGILIKNPNRSLRDSRNLSLVSKSLKRKLLRRLFYTGGVKATDGEKILSLGREAVNLVFAQLNLVKITGDWFSLREFDRPYSKVPIYTAGIKMLSCVPKIDFNVFYDGLRRHAGRFYESMAPTEVVNFTLQGLGFTISNNTVSTNNSTAGVLSRGEDCFIKTIRKYDDVISFFELAEEFLNRGFAIATAAKVAGQSPIVEKTSHNLYIIRGNVVPWEQIENARQRQKRFTQNEDIKYGMDGIIRLKITITRFSFLSGVINSNRISDLTGKWQVFIDEMSCGQAVLEDLFLWGLMEAFTKLQVNLGDRIELAFNTWNRKLIIKKV